MKRSTAFMLSGAGLGLFVGSSMGVAAGDTAYNAAVFLTPLGAFIGWLLSFKNQALDAPVLEVPENTRMEDISGETDSKKSERSGPQLLVHSTMAIMASVWNFHIDLLKTLGLLSTFVRQPLFFLGLAVVVSVAFPPFLLVYFFAWLGASYFGLSEKEQYRVEIT
jgi:hypothetical protein